MKESEKSLSSIDSLPSGLQKPAWTRSNQGPDSYMSPTGMTEAQVHGCLLPSEAN